jgi:hypothetical protein
MELISRRDLIFSGAVYIIYLRCCSLTGVSISEACTSRRTLKFKNFMMANTKTILGGLRLSKYLLYPYASRR